MNIKALITMLVLGSSSAAMAAPAVSVNASVEASWSTGYRTGPVIRDHRYREPVPVTRTTPYRRPAPGWEQPVSNIKLNTDSSEYTGPIYTRQPSYGWAALTDPTRIEMKRQIVRVNGQFSAFMLQNVSGSSHIDLVKIMFRDGHQETVNINQDLTGWRSQTTFAVNRAPIDYIVVYGTTNGNSTYRVLGS